MGAADQLVGRHAARSSAGVPPPRMPGSVALLPYVPRLVVEWLHDQPEVRHRQLDGTFVFADISGFTALTERLAVRDKAGAEEMGELLNQVFEQLLTAAYDYGASLLKWGGDAVLLMFDGDEHAARAARAAGAMQSTLRHAGRLHTSQGAVRLGMSIGLHTGTFDALLLGSRHRELILTGPGVSVVAAMEKVANRGDVVMSPDTAAALPASCRGEPIGDGVKLRRPPDVGQQPNRAAKPSDVDLGLAFCAPLRDYLAQGVVDYEHRAITVGFIEFSGVDGLLAKHGSEAFVEAVGYVVDAVQAAADDNGVTVLASDICADGGKLILTSGVPMSLGDDETRVLAVVRRVVHPRGRLRLRAGVTCGRVFAGNYGPAYRRTYSIAGDIVNLAARLMAKAGDGEVLAIPAVVARSKTPFATTPVAPFAVKGKAAPVEAVLVGDPRAATAPTTGNRLPLIGRDAELADLLEIAGAAQRGIGQVVEIVGPPGIGKTRLLEELTDRADMRMLWADGDVYGKGTPYQPLQRLFRRTLGLPDDVEPQTLAAVLRDLVEGTAPELVPWLPLIGVVAGVELPSTPEVDLLDPEVRKGRLEEVTSELLGRLLPMPLVMVCNDVYFMDDATVDMLRRLARDVAGRPWMVVLTSRPDFAAPLGDATLPDGVGVTRMRLAPLPAAAADQLLAAVTRDAPLPPHRMRELAERSGGNPLFLRELSAGIAAGHDADTLPDSVEGVIAARIDRLAPRLRRWLRSAAVLGMVIDPDVIDDVAGEPSPPDDEVVDFLARAADGRLQFVHHLVQQTAYEGLPYRRRSTLHARAAEVLERRAGDRADEQAGLLSLHWLHGGRYDAAWRYSRLAGDRARRQYALTEAAACYRRGLSAAAHLRGLAEVEVAEVCEALSDVHIDLGELPAAEQALRRARVAARADKRRLARLRLKTATHREQDGRYAEALRWASRGRSLLETFNDSEALRLRAELAERYARIRYRQGEYAAAIQWADRGVAEARRCGDRGSEAQGLEMRALAAATAGRPWDDADFVASLALHDALGDLRSAARAHNRFGAAAYYTGRWDLAAFEFTGAESAYRRIGREYDAAVNAANRAEVLIEQGRHAEAAPLLTDALAVWRAAGATSYLAFGTALLGRVALAEQRWDDAASLLGEARQMCADLGEADEVASADALLAECRLWSGDPAGALTLADETLLGLGHAAAAAAALPRLHRVRGEAMASMGRDAEATAALRASLQVSRDRAARHEVAAALAALLRSGSPVDEPEAASWRAEHDQLTVALGLVGPV
ncbi:MAG TPA: adenylate/guanylate cyclase domain-containing protein [Mycobacteriales bacterium]|nr:adenylate/guanylate cyclase domain-containing protein [Mycobacteriales bacterium]